MTEWLKNVAFGMLPLLALGVVVFLWVGIPMIWMSYSDPEGKQFSTLGTVWVLLPLAVIVVSVLHWAGKAIRDKEDQ